MIRWQLFFCTPGCMWICDKTKEHQINAILTQNNVMISTVALITISKHRACLITETGNRTPATWSRTSAKFFIKYGYQICTGYFPFWNFLSSLWKAQAHYFLSWFNCEWAISFYRCLSNAPVCFSLNSSGSGLQYLQQVTAKSIIKKGFAFSIFSILIRAFFSDFLGQPS